MTQTRRQFLSSAAGIAIAVTLPVKGRAQSGAAQAFQGDGSEGTFAPNAFIRIAPDDTVTVLIKHIEMGQGANTGLAVPLAEELDADWGQIRAESAPLDTEKYKNLAFGLQGTGGSTGLANSYMQMRKAGAAARALLVQAAAEEWGVPADEISIFKGIVSHGEQTSTFGPLAVKASGMTPPEDPPLKDPADFVYIGQTVPKLDTPAKSNGTAIYTLDVYREGMETVVVAHPPYFGATVASYDDAEATQVPGVTAVRQIPTGIAVYATSTAAALKGREALRIEWDTSAAETRSSAQIMEDFAAMAGTAEALVAEEAGDAAGALDTASQTVEMEFRFPYLAHVPLEALDAVLEVKDGRAESWGGWQFPGFDAGAIAQVLGIDQANVSMNTMFAGGSFGRRAQPTAHIGAEVAEIAKAAGRDGAWKLVWTREDDLHGGYYRPMTVHKMRGGLDADGNITAWHNTVVNQSIMAGTPMEAMMQDGMDPTSYEGSTKMPYDLLNARIDWIKAESPVSVLWWRSVGHTHTAYATEVFLDELLAKAGKDPVQGRLDLLKDDMTRDRAVLEKVAEMAGWNGDQVKGGRGFGVALHESFGSYVAMIAEVEDRGGMPHVTRVWTAIDCGRAVNPDVVRAQIEGGMGYGLGSVLLNEVVLEEGGRVAQSNLDTYPIMRIDRMPQIEIEILDSDADPTGVGEPGTPPIGPAVANAWRALTGETVTTLPFASRAGA